MRVDLLVIAGLALTACQAASFDAVAQRQAEDACDHARAEAFPETVNGGYEFMIGDPQFAGVDGPAGTFELVYTWQGRDQQRVRLFCRGNHVSHTVEYVEFLGARRSATAENDWSY